MSKGIARLAMSLDGYITGPDSGVEHPLGIGGERLFDSLGTDHIEWEKTAVHDSLEVTHIHLRALK